MGEIVTKSELARRFGVDRSQPTAWASRGMPVRHDGRLDYEVAAAWVRRSVDSTKRQRAQERRTTRDEQNEALDQIGRLGVWFMCQRVAASLPGWAAEAGIAPEQAEALRKVAFPALLDLANDTAENWMGIAPNEPGPFDSLKHVRMLKPSQEV